MISILEILVGLSLYLAARQDYQQMEFEEGYVWAIVFTALAYHDVFYYLNPTHLLTIVAFTALSYAIYLMGFWADGDAMMLSAIAFAHADWRFMTFYLFGVVIGYAIILADRWIDQIHTYGKVINPWQDEVAFLPSMFIGYVLTVLLL